MERRRIEIQDSAAGIQPELALVLETVGSVENFINAVRRIKGLEWLGEFDVDDIAPGEGFEDAKDPEKPLSGRLYLVMTDERALRQIQSLFDRWKQNPDTDFPYGLANLKRVFAHLRAIRPWDVQDRIAETGVLDNWRFRVAHGQDVVPFEAELWFRHDPKRRRQAEGVFRTLVEEVGGDIAGQCVLEEIAYHGILGRVPAGAVQTMLEQREVRLLQCDDVWYFRPVGQCAVPSYEDLREAQPLARSVPDSPTKPEPLVALLDGLPLANHRLLDGRLIVDDPDGYEATYQAHERVHGTAMASLICHGDLDEKGAPSDRPVYARPIMQPRHGFDGQFHEAIPEDVLPVDLIHRAVRRLFEGDGEEAPVAPTVRVINLSVGDSARLLDREMSAWARLLDWLAWKYNVLFIVSAGNHGNEIVLDVPRADFQRLTDEERERAVICALASDTRNRRLLSPAETVNGLTVGALHADASTLPSYHQLIDPYARTGLPSPVNAHGPGYRRAVKPDILLPGGRQFYREKMGNTHSNATLEVASYLRPPGQCVAAPGDAGQLDRTVHLRGTSNAAALASRAAMRLYDEVLEQLRTAYGVPAAYDAVLLKTLLAHGASWGDAYAIYEAILKNNHGNSRTFKNYVGRFLGYGPADLARVAACTDQRVTVLGYGALEDGQAHVYRLPLPPSLSASTERRRLTVTLAWITPVNPARRGYRIAHLWFDPKNGLAPTRLDADYHAVRRGTLQHEVREGHKAEPFQDGDAITLKVRCRADAGEIMEPVRYGLAVTLEVAEGVSLPIYQEVRDRLRVPVRIAGREGTT
ncbi:S8 family serine peptidase [Rhodocaloribacter sp.]